MKKDSPPAPEQRRTKSQWAIEKQSMSVYDWMKVVFS